MSINCPMSEVLVKSVPKVVHSVPLLNRGVYLSIITFFNDLLLILKEFKKSDVFFSS